MALTLAMDFDHNAQLSNERVTTACAGSQPPGQGASLAQNYMAGSMDVGQAPGWPQGMPAQNPNQMGMFPGQVSQLWLHVENGMPCLW